MDARASGLSDLLGLRLLAIFHVRMYGFLIISASKRIFLHSSPHFQGKKEL
jgi:hypothetical protein